MLADSLTIQKLAAMLADSLTVRKHAGILADSCKMQKPAGLLNSSEPRGPQGGPMGPYLKMNVKFH